jgi:Abortive infection C-terminus
MPEAAATAAFVMYAAREAMASGLGHVEEQIKSIELAVVDNPGLAFDLAKTLIESACKTILTERDVRFADADDLPRLFRTTTNNLPFLPAAASADADARRSLAQTLGGLSSAVQGICGLRNACGFASHGSGRRRTVMEGMQALLAAQAADAIVGFLHRAHRRERAILPTARLEYTDHPEFNAYLDDSNEPVRIFDLQYTPSEALFHVDMDAYRDLLANYEPQDEAADAVEVRLEPAEAIR